MFDITTPAILFPAISLILLAYTAKLLHLGNLARNLKVQYFQSRDKTILEQIANLRKRIYLIRNMQFCGVGSFFFSVLCMLFLFFNETETAMGVFGISLIFLLAALYFSFREVQMSATALRIELKDVLVKEKRS